MVRRYDEELVAKAFNRLQGAEESEFVKILAHLETGEETLVQGRFFDLLRRLGRQKSRKKAYAVARVMLQMLARRGWDEQDFVLGMMNGNVIKTNRLHLAVMLNFFSVSPSLILADLFNDQHSSTDLEKAANNFPVKAVVDLMKFVAANSSSPDNVLKAMRTEDAFRYGYVVDVTKSRFSEAELVTFIKTCCDAIDVEIPSEARLLFLRVRLEKELATFFRGETEILDFHNICAAICEDDDDLMAYCVQFVARRSNPIAKLMSRMRNTPFIPAAAVNNYVPVCSTIGSFHELACAKTVVIDDATTAIEFDERLSDCRQIAVLYHVNASQGEGVYDLFAFRLSRRVFFYLPKQSRNQRDDVAASLERHGRKRVFLFKKAAALGFLDAEFGWKPTDVTDVGELAVENSIRPSLTEMAMKMTGGCCSRGRNFASVGAIPSPIALSHLNANVSLIYDFAVKFKNLGGAEIREGVDELEKRKRSRDRGADGGGEESRESRKKAKKVKKAESRSRSRHEKH